MDATVQRLPRGSDRGDRPQGPAAGAPITYPNRPPHGRTRVENPRRAALARRRQARRRLGHALAATIPLTEFVLLAALVAFPNASSGTLFPVAGVVAFAASVTLTATHIARETRRAGLHDPALVRAAIAGVAAATAIAWAPILGALALASL